MKIAATDLGLQANRLFASHEERSERLRTWRGKRPDFEGMESAMTRISDAARQLLSAPPPTPQPPAPRGTGQANQAQALDAAHDAQDAVDNDPFLAMVRQMIEFLTGEKVKVFDMRELTAEMRQVEVRASNTQASLRTAGPGQANGGMEYDAHRLYEEFEQTTFRAAGKIRTTDGQEFSFTLDLQMTRSYREESTVSVRTGNAVRRDPLVVNFGGTGAQLQDRLGQGIRFDIDGDGRPDWLPLFASASGYLALDRNGNGRIDSGQELFGPASGNGFTDLARLDQDGNGWIDETDPAFDKLSVWTPAAQGDSKLSSLADLGIGALALAHAASPFALRGKDNSDLGQVRSSGIFLNEDGTAGNLQEVDLTI